MQGNITINLETLRRLAQLGPKRASAFVRLGTELEKLPFPSDFSLPSDVSYAFWPNEIPDALKSDLRGEFRYWLTGNALKELDQCFCIFLNYAWFAIEVANLHGTQVPSSHKFGEGFEDLNASQKLRRIASHLSYKPNIECFHSLVFARHYLTHNAGVVGRRHSKRQIPLAIKWLAIDIELEDDDFTISLREAMASGYRVKSPNGASVIGRVNKRTKSVPPESMISFDISEIAEICAFYSNQSAALCASVTGYLKQKLAV